MEFCRFVIMLTKCGLLLIVYVQIYNGIQINAEKLNILLILIDDLRHLSPKNVYLPNIRELATKGVNCKNTFAQQALCAPSRNSLLTGRRPDSLRLYDFYNYWRDTIANFTTLPQFFKENGYNTFSVGKVFHPGQSSNFTDDYPYSWTHPPYHPPTEIFKDAAVCRDKISKKLQMNLVCPVTVHKQPGQTLPDLESLDYAIDILKTSNDSKPFFLAVGFHKPHIPLKFPKEFLYSFPINTLQPPKYPNIPKKLPLVAWHSWTDIRRRDDIKRLNLPLPFGIMPRKWTLKIRQSYFAAAQYIDTLIGVLMSYVDKRKTVVVLTSDHGWSLGENGLWAKYSNFDVALKVPLIFIAPGLRPNVIQTPVELLDVFPTLVDLAGISQNIPACKDHSDKTALCFEGKSLVPMMMDKDRRMMKGAYAISQYPRPSEYPQEDSDKPRLKNIKIMGYSIRTNRYRYTEWASFNSTSFTINWNKVYGLELYDHVTNPDESDNLVNDLKYKNIKNKLSKILRNKVDPKTI